MHLCLVSPTDAEQDVLFICFSLQTVVISSYDEI